MNRVAVPGRNCWKLSRADHAGVLVDARDYYKAIYESMLGARRYALLAGWQFDSDVRLLRGKDADAAPLPVELLPFFEALCKRQSDLSIYVLAWDYSVVYTFEREWMQRLKFDFGTSDRIRYQLDGKHPLGASHHQKFVVIDGRIAFIGGADVCDGRWDDRRHAAENAERVNRYGELYKPYHEVVACLTGAAVADVEQTFRERWLRASGTYVEAPQIFAKHGDPVSFEGIIPIESNDVAIARTLAAGDATGLSGVHEIRRLYEDAIRSAERLIYVESQYITSRAFHDALNARLSDEGRPRLRVVLVVPHGSDTFKEELALGASEKALLASIGRVACAHGHDLRVLFSAAGSAGAKPIPSDAATAPPTFIHSKLMIVDDRFVTIGSANCTNRSFSVDSELNVAWECEGEDDPLARSLAFLRASLLSEHAGIEHDASFERIDGVIERIDELLSRGSRLRLRAVTDTEDGDAPLAILQLAFDPEGPLLERAIDELLGSRRVCDEDSADVEDPEPSPGAAGFGRR